MRKVRMLTLGVIATALCCSLLMGAVMTGSARTTVGSGAVEGTNFLQQEVYYLDKSFDESAAHAVGPEDVAGVYLPPDYGSAIIDNFSQALITGEKSLAFTPTAASDVAGNQFMSLKGTSFVGAMTDDAAYFVSFQFKSLQPTTAKLFVNVRNGWANSAQSFLAEYRKTFQYNDTQINGATNDIAGWTGADQKYKNEAITFENGVANVYFEFDTTTANTAGCVAMEFFGVYGAGDTFSVDNIRVGKVGEPAKYFTKDVDVDYDGILGQGEVFELQPIWGDTIAFETEEALDGTASVKLSANNVNNATIGGFTNNAPGEPKNFSNKIGLYYFQMDIDIQGLSLFNLYTGGTDYVALIYDGSAFRSEGKIANLRTVNMGYFTRVSFYINYAVENNDHKINATGTGYVMIDNLIIAREDYTPFVQDGSVDRIGADDVTVKAYAKDKAFTKINGKGGSDLTPDTDFVETDGELTLKKELFASVTSATVFEYVTAGGTCEFTIAVNDNRTAVTAITALDVLTKVYDGTTAADISKVGFTLAGVTAGDDVTLRAAAVFADKNAGTTTVTLTDLVLEGADAAKYRFAEGLTTVSVNAVITPIQLECSLPTVTASKVYDGTDIAQATAGTLSNVLSGDTVTLTIAEARFDSKNVGATAITVKFAVDNANYTAPADVVITDGVAVTPKAITVTATAANKHEGEQDPTLEYTATGLVDGDTLTGALSRAAGEAVGEYDITLGTLANANYTITFEGAKFTVEKKQATGKAGCGAGSLGGFTGLGGGMLLLTAFGLIAATMTKKRNSYEK